MISQLEQIKKFGSGQFAFKIVCAMFVTLIIWNIISAITLFSGLNHTVQHEEVSVPNTSAPQQKKPLILNYKLFGEYVPKNLEAVGVRQSTLNLTVVGVLFAVNEQNSQVILRKPSGQEEFFHVDDELPGGGVIKRITEEGVLVARDGVLERLSLPKQELKFEDPIKLEPVDRP